MLDPLEFIRRDDSVSISHYHGDTVRILFLIGGIVILATLPFFNNLLEVGPVFLPVFVVVLALGGAIINPFQRWTVLAGLIVSAIAVVLFEYTAVIGFGNEIFLLSVIRQAIAIIFLFALYYSGRTLRAMLMHQIGKKNGQSYD